MQTFIRGGAFGIALWAQAALVPSAALACGGFFCNRAQPVNQAAEGIIFADNGDGTTTAVIQIRYQGPSQSFSWLLPISSAPKSDADIGIASNLAFQRLQAATNPNYRLNLKTEGTCKQEDFTSFPTASGGTVNSGAGGASSSGNPSVVVEASGVVGAFEWTVISVNSSAANPADIAVAWLQDNGYDVPSGSPKLLGPYLEAGMHLLALKLTKGADSGSIRPIMLTYAGTQPSIPMKLTAVAANADMGVLTWVLGKSRAVPQNYLSLELNEARINWFNANSNYNSVVTAAADDAGGQGFVTEFAGPAASLQSVIWTASDDANWTSFKSAAPQVTSDFFTQANARYGQWDGFWDATRVAVTLPADVTLDQLKACTTCFASQLSFVPANYLAELEKTVIEPVKSVQALIDAHPEITRMYTTLSADEMTLDPLFTFNTELPAVSNQHVADRIVECNPNVTFSQAPWRIELPQGGVIRGIGGAGTWPAALGNLPPNRLIVRAAASGEGKVLEDNSSDIVAQLGAYNESVSQPTAGAAGTIGVAGQGTGGESAIGQGGGTAAGAGAGAGSRAPGGTGGASAVSTAPSSSAGGGCSLARNESPLFALFTAGALGAMVARRRRRR